MPQASVDTFTKWLEFAKEEIEDHGILMNIALQVLHENFRINKGGIIYKKDKNYKELEKEKYALKYLIEEWDYGWSETE